MRVGHDQDVGKQDRAVEAEAADRLERDLGGRLAVVDQLEEPALLGPQRAIFGQVAAGLTHQPDRAARPRFHRASVSRRRPGIGSVQSK